ncbi:MAG: ATP-binding protein [Phycisphaerales bacterium]
MKRDYSPFTPGIPTTPEQFRGKAEEVKALFEASRAAAKGGRFERTFLIGDRGIGKSSLCAVVRELADRELSMLTAHVFLGGASTVEEMCRRVFDRLASESVKRPWHDKLKALLGKHIKQVGLFGVSVGFQASAEDLRGIAEHFHTELGGLLERLRGEREGMLLILDDINGLAEQRSFAQWLKSFVDTVALMKPTLPLHLVLSGTGDRRDALLAHQPSLDRVFTIRRTGLIQNSDATQFLTDTFARAGVTVEPKALSFMVGYAAGYPALLQEIGDAVFRFDSDDRVDLSEAKRGTIEAAKVVGEKYLNQGVLSAIRSGQYRAILGKLASRWDKQQFERSEIDKLLSDEEQRSFDKFVHRMRELGVLDSTEAGTYRFVNPLHRIYYWHRAVDEAKASKK